MMLRGGPHAGTRRPGVILMVVLAMLTLFAIVGLSFVLVANAQEASSRIAREAETQFKPGIDPEAALSLFLGQMIYDSHDDAVGCSSALRGHSLARNMYGYYYDYANLAAAYPNDKPYTGTGRLHQPTHSMFGGAGVYQSDAFVVNYQYMGDGFVRDPERLADAPAATPDLKFRTSPSQLMGPTTAAPTSPLFRYTGGLNVPYTYPDHQNFYLAHLDPATGRVTMPSFHREYLAGRFDDPAAWGVPLPASDPGYAAALLAARRTRYMTGRPHPYFHPNFPLPMDRYGDVKNLDGAPGGADSIWIDIGAPVMTAPDGTKYKMLVAPLILDLDNRVNLNVVGNMLGQSAAPAVVQHRSNQGWGPWEINPAAVLNQDATEWQNLFNGSQATGLARIRGRYDNNATRAVQGPPPSGITTVRGWAHVDFNAANDTTRAESSALQFPQFKAAGPDFALYAYSPFPTFNVDSYAGGAGAETTNHPAAFSPLAPTAPNRKFPVSAMARLLRHGGSHSEAADNTLFRLLPTNLSDATRRRLVTLLSADLDRPGVTPYVWDRSGAAPTNPADTNTAIPPLKWSTDLQGVPTLGSTANPAAVPPVFNKPISFPVLALRPPPTTPPALPLPLSMPPQNLTEFDHTTWRSTLASIGRLDMKRQLPLYQPVGMETMSAVHERVTPPRQRFAQEIYDVLRSVTGAQDPATAYAIPTGMPAVLGQSPDFNALRYLAQLAVNIVDNTDEDDVSTPFLFYSAPGVQEWVFGYELNRLVINETLATIQNRKDSLETVAGMTRVKMGGDYAINVWVELMNPLRRDAASQVVGKGITGDCTATLQDPGAAGQKIYLLELVSSQWENVLTNKANSLGDPDFGKAAADPSRVLGVVADWNDGATELRQVLPVTDAGGNGFQANQTAAAMGMTPAKYDQTGFYVVAPAPTEFIAGEEPNLSYTIKSSAMTWFYNAKDYEDSENGVANKPPVYRPMVVLRRLANPKIPAQPNPTLAGYNPYITVDAVPITGGQVNDARKYKTTGDHTGDVNYKALGACHSYGRVQPFAGNISERRMQEPATVVADVPPTTFFRQNCKVETKAQLDAYDATTYGAANETLKLPFDWPTHLDRLPVGVGDVITASPHRPMDVLQYFSVNNGLRRNADIWLDANARLYRFLEFVSKAPISSGRWGRPGGRVQGLVNVNTVWPDVTDNADAANIWRSRVMAALTDSQNPNAFSPAEAAAVVRILMDHRSPRLMQPNGMNPPLPPLANEPYAPAPTDPLLATALQPVHRPYWGLGLGTAPAGNDAMFGNANGRGLDNTLLRVDNPPPPAFSRGRMLDVTELSRTGGHPYLTKQLMTKVMGNLTTRSNTFAVWMTVGFFEVDNETTTPVTLGREVGKAENRHVRYRTFSIIDRTNLQLWPTYAPGSSVAMVRAKAAINPTLPTTANMADPGTPMVPQWVDPTKLPVDPVQDTAWPEVALIDDSVPVPKDIGDMKYVNPTTMLHEPKFPTVTNPLTGRTLTIGEGSILTYEPGTENEETVTVRLRADRRALIADFKRAHPLNCVVVSRGNPGPWSSHGNLTAPATPSPYRYNPRLDADVVPFFQLLD